MAHAHARCGLARHTTHDTRHMKTEFWNLINIRAYTSWAAYCAQPQLPHTSYGVMRDAHRSAQGTFDALRQEYPDCVVVAIVPTYGIVRWSADNPNGLEVKP